MESLAEEVGRVLTWRGWMLATAESCTGGGIAACVTEVPGSSAWFDRGWVTYSNASKCAMLGVDLTLIAQYGAVSEAVVGAMASGALARSAAQMALAVSGVAGPSGGSRDKPVGTVCLAWAWDGQVETVTRHFDGNRESVRRQAALGALEGVLARARGPVVT